MRAPSRREFVVGASGLIGMFALGGIGTATIGADDLLRPPGGQDEDALIERCIKCDRCRSVCPEGIVVTSRLEDGLVNARTPKLDFHKGYCTFCDKCIEVCPTQALTPFDETTERIGTAIIDRDECIAWNQGGCDKCVTACPVEAVVFDDHDRPVVVSDPCNGCGLCEYICPSASYGSYDGNRRHAIYVKVGLGES